MQQARIVHSLFALSLVVSLTGCGVLLGGTSKNIWVTSSPAGASVSTRPQVGSFTTPTILSLERKKSYVLVASRDGYNDARVQIRKSIRVGPLLFDIFLTSFIGVIVDAVTGGLWDLEPEIVTIALERADDNGDGPLVIEVSVRSSNDDPGSLIVEATAPVRVELVHQ